MFPHLVATNVIEGEGWDRVAQTSSPYRKLYCEWCKFMQLLSWLANCLVATANTGFLTSATFSL